MAATAGKGGSLTTGSPSHTYQITGWTVDDSVELLDDTNSASGGETEYVAGVTDVGGSFTMNYDPSASFIPDLTPGVTLTTLDMVVTGTQKYSVASAIVESRSLNLTIKGLVEVTVNWKGNGITLGTADNGLTS